MIECFCHQPSQHADADADAVAAEAEALDECPASEAADTVDFFAGRTLLGTVAEGAGAVAWAPATEAAEAGTTVGAANNKRSMGCTASGSASSWSLQVKICPFKIWIVKGNVLAASSAVRTSSASTVLGISTVRLTWGILLG